MKKQKKLKPHVRRQIKDSTLLRGEAAAEYAHWNEILEAEGLRAYDNAYGQTIASLNRRAMRRSNGPNTADFEFYDVLRDYCRYYHYEFSYLSKESKQRKQQFLEIMVAFASGCSMQEAYNLVGARNDESEMYSAIHFFKLVQECKEEYLRNFQNFSALTLKLIDDATGQPVSYSWADPESRRIGINLQWFQSDFAQIEGDSRFEPLPPP